MILDAFAGPGGWDEGMRQLGRTDVVGIEWDADACATAHAAGHARIRADVEAFPLGHLAGHVEGLILSPPCPDFSTAGKRRGVEGTSGRLIYQVLRWAQELAPQWIACEQVPPAVRYWGEFARELRALGYATAYGVINARSFGVPQDRERAVLVASRSIVPEIPKPTVALWTGAADVLDVDPAALIGFPRRADRGRAKSIDGEQYRARDLRPASRPAFTLTEKARSWQVWTDGGGASADYRRGAPTSELPA